MRARIVCLPGDGIGPEIMQEAVRVLTSVACAFNHSFTFVEDKLGKAALQAYGTPLHEKTVQSCLQADAVLLGAAGGSNWDKPAQEFHPEQGVSLLQRGLDLYACLMYCAIPPAPVSASPVKESLVGTMDMVLVRPLQQDSISSSFDEEILHAADTMAETALHAEQVIRLAFRLARERRKYLCGTFLPELSATTRLWRDTALRVTRDYPDVTARWLEPDRCAAELVKRPSKFDVLLAGPLAYGPLSGVAAGLTGGLGLSPCVFVGDGNPSVYLPAQGEEPLQAGRDTANPIGMILSAARMLRKSLHLLGEADCVETAVKNVLDSGWRTADMVSGTEPKVGTQAIGKLIAEQVDTAGAIMGAFRR